jgi:putative FmdB family regulatory protein
MPIYAYRCASCGHAQDVLQKMSDPLLTVCPACGADTFSKQLTAAGFQLKGSGWYVTDFRGGNTGAKKEGADDKPAGASADKPADKAGGAPTEASPAAKPASADKPAAAPAASPTPATPSS